MEANAAPGDQEVEEDFVLLDLEAVHGLVDIPPNAPYILSGLDTLNPILVIDNKLKLIGHYEETIGTCVVFNEQEASPFIHAETGPSEVNLFSSRGIIDPSYQASGKEVKPVASVTKILKFRLLPPTDADFEDATANLRNNDIEDATANRRDADTNCGQETSS